MKKSKRKADLYAETVEQIKAMRTRRIPGMKSIADVVACIVNEHVGRMRGTSISQAVREDK